MFATQFNIPTYCEICNRMMFWNIRDRGLECENCKFSCHKKCSQQIMAPCANAPREVRLCTIVFVVLNVLNVLYTSMIASFLN